MRALSELGFCHGGDDVHLSLGQLVCGDYDLYTIAFTITFSLLFVAELILRSIEALAENTAYQVMVQKIFKEMTALGFITLVTLLLTLSTSSSGQPIIPDAIHPALQHADFVIFIMSLYSVVQASLLILLSINHAKRWRKAYNHNIHKVLLQFVEDEHHAWRRWLLSSETRELVELKIIQIAFCKLHNIRKSEFNFASYLIESFEKYLVGLLEDKFHTRIFLGFMIAVNTLRVKSIEPNIPDDCTSPECSVDRDLQFFVVCGWILVVAGSIHACVSRTYEIKVLQVSGVETVNDYRSYLLAEEKVDLEKEKRAQKKGGRRESTTLGVTEIKDSLRTYETLKKSHEEAGIVRRESHMLKMYNTMLTVVGMGGRGRSRSQSNGGSFSLVDGDEAPVAKMPTGPRLSLVQNVGNRPRAASNDSEEGAPDGRSSPPPHMPPSGDVPNLQPQIVSFETLMSRSKAAAKAPFKGMGNLMRSNSTNFSSVSAKKHALPSSQRVDGPRDFNQVFLCGTSVPYFLIIQYLLQLNCIYFALWCTNYVVLPTHSSNAAMWHILMILPMLFMVPIFVYIMTVSSTLHAIAKLDPEVVGKILEDSEATERNAGIVRSKILNRLRSYEYERNATGVNSAESEAMDHHNLIDMLVRKYGVRQGEEYVITRDAFNKMTNKLQLHFTAKKIASVFEYIDRDLDGNITSSEVFRFVYSKEARKESLDERERLVEVVKTKRRSRSHSSFISLLRRGSVALFGGATMNKVGTGTPAEDNNTELPQPNRRMSTVPSESENSRYYSESELSSRRSSVSSIEEHYGDNQDDDSEGNGYRIDDTSATGPLQLLRPNRSSMVRRTSQGSNLSTVVEFERDADDTMESSATAADSKSTNYYVGFMTEPIRPALDLDATSQNTGPNDGVLV